MPSPIKVSLDTSDFVKGQKVISESLSKIQKDADSTQKTFDKIDPSVDTAKVQSNTKIVTSSFDQIKKSAIKTQTSLEKIKRPQLDTANIERGTKTITSSFEKIKSQATSTSKSFDKIKASFKSMVMGFAAGFSAQYMVKEILSIGSAFQQTMTTVGGIMSDINMSVEGGGQAFKDLQKAAREAGSTTKFSATEAGTALKYMALAGWDSATSIASLPKILNLATAGELELGRASDIVTDSMTAMGLGVNDLSRFTDILVSTSTRANTDINMLGEAFKYAAPVAKGMGIEVESLSAYLGTMANGGIKASQAGNMLKGIMLSTGKAAGMLGISTDELNSSQDKLRLVFEKASEAGWTATEMEKAFGREQVSSALIIKDSLSTYDDLKEKLNNVGGETEELAGIMSSTVSGAFKELSSVLQDQAINVFDEYKASIYGALKDTASFIKDHADNILKLADFFVKLGQGVLAYIAIMTTLKTITAATTAATWLYNTAIQANNVSVATGTGLFSSFNKVLATNSVRAQVAAGSITMIQVALGVLMAAVAGFQLGRWLDENVEGVRATMIEIINSFSKAWIEVEYSGKKAFETINYGMEGFAEYIIEKTHGASASFASFWESIKYIGAVTVEGMKSVFLGFFDTILENMATFVNTLAKALSFIGQDDLAKSLKGFSGAMKDAIGGSESFLDVTRKLREESKRTKEEIKQKAEATIKAEKERMGINENATKQYLENLKKLDEQKRKELDLNKRTYESSMKEAEAMFKKGDSVKKVMTLEEARAKAKEKSDKLLSESIKKQKEIEEKAVKEKKIREEKLSKELIKIAEKENKKKKEINDKLNIEIAQMGMNKYEKELDNLDRWFTDQEQYAQDWDALWDLYYDKHMTIVDKQLDHEVRAREKALKEQEKLMKKYEKGVKEDPLMGGKEEASKRAQMILFEDEERAKKDKEELEKAKKSFRGGILDGNEIDSYVEGLKGQLEEELNNLYGRGDSPEKQAVRQKGEWRIEGLEGQKRYGPTIELLMDTFLSDLDENLKENFTSLIGKLGGAFKDGLSMGEMKEFLIANKGAFADIAEHFSYRFRIEGAAQTETQKKLDKVAEGLGQMGWVGSLVNVGWQAGRGMTERTEGGMVSGGKWVEVGDVSTGDYSADPAMVYASQKLFGENYRTGGQQFAAAMKSGDVEGRWKSGGAAVAEWTDPGGALLSKWASDELGGFGKLLSTSGLLGTSAILGKNSFIGDAFGLNKENFYRFGDLGKQEDVQTYMEDQSWSRDKGFASRLKETEITDDMHWYAMIEASYKNGINDINDTFNEQALDRMGKLPDEYASALANQLEAYGDFTFEIPEGRLNAKNWQQDITRFLTNYQDKISQVMDDATISLIDQYIQAGGEIGANLLTQETKSSLIAQQFQKIDEEGKGVVTEEGEPVYMDAIDTAFQRLEIMQQIEQVWTDINSALDISLAEPLTEYAARFEVLGTAFDSQLLALEELGFSETALGEVRVKQAEFIKRENDAFADKRQALINSIAGTEESRTKVEEMTESIRQLGGTTEDFTAMNSAFASERENFINGLAQSQESLGAVESIVKNTNAAYEKHRETLKQLGGTVVDYTNLEVQRISTIRNSILNMADEATVKFDNIRQQIAEIEFKAGGGTSAEFTMKNLQTQISMGTAESLSAASDLLVQWYGQASSEAQQQAKSQISGGMGTGQGSIIEAMEASTEAADKWIKATEIMESLVKTIDNTINGMKYGALNVSTIKEKFEMATKDYEKLRAEAQTGGKEEVQEFVKFSSQYLEQAQSHLGSSTTYQKIYSDTMSDLENLKTTMTPDQFLKNVKDSTTQTATATGVGISGGISRDTGTKADLSDVNAQFKVLSKSIEDAMKGLADKEAVLNINWGGITGDSKSAISLISGIFEQYGTDGVVTMTFMSEFVENFEGPIAAKMDALGFVAGETGWDSTATMKFISSLGATGQGSWDTIKKQMDEAGIGGTTVTQLKFAFEYDINRWQQDIAALISKGVGYTQEIAGFGTTTVTGANTAFFQGASGESFSFGTGTDLSQLASQFSAAGQIAQLYKNTPTVDLAAISRKYPGWDYTKKETATKVLNYFNQLGKEDMKALIESQGHRYEVWHYDMEQVLKQHGLPAPPYATGGMIDRSLGDDGLISVKTGAEGIITAEGIRALEELNSGDLSRFENMAGSRIQTDSTIVSELREIKALLRERDNEPIKIENNIDVEFDKKIIKRVSEEVIVERDRRNVPSEMKIYK